MSFSFDTAEVTTRADRSGLAFPLLVTFLASLLISLVSIHFSPILNRDGMLYTYIASLFSHGATEKALAVFDWPFFSMLMVGAKEILPFSLLSIAYGTSLLFSALTTVMLVVLLKRVAPEHSVWWAVLVALCMPALNEYRPYVLRDWPAWFFMLLSIWAYLCYLKRSLWRWALIFLAALLFAFLSRMEAVVIAAPIFLLSLFDPALCWKDRLRLFALPIIAAVAMLAALLIDPSRFTDRLLYYWGIINPTAIYHSLHVSGDALAKSVLTPYSEENGTKVLVVGLLSLIPFKIVSAMFALFVPWLIARWHGKLRFPKELRLYGWLAFAWLLLSVLFLLHQHYLSSRYLVPLMLFILPFLYVGMLRLREWSLNPWLWGGLVFLIVVQGLSGAISTRGDEKLAIKTAGNWVADNLRGSDCVYINDGRVSFYAGRTYFSDTYGENDQEAGPDNCWQVRLVSKRQATLLEASLALHFQLVRTFDSGGSRVVLLFQRKAQ